MTGRALALPLTMLVLAAALLAAYAAVGGTDYAKVQGTEDPCRDRAAASRPVAPQLEALAERVVLLGLDETACNQGISRERLVLALPKAQDRRALARDLGISEAELARQVKAGLVRAINRLDRAGRLPKASALLPAVLDELNLPGPARTLIEAVPERTVDSLAPTGAVLRRAIAVLDVSTLIDGISGSGTLEGQLRDSIQKAAVDEIRERLLSQLPDSVRGLLGD